MMNKGYSDAVTPGTALLSDVEGREHVRHEATHTKSSRGSPTRIGPRFVAFFLPASAICILILGIAVIVLQVLILRTQERCFPYWADSEFGTVKNEIRTATKQVHFTAGLRFNESHKLYRTKHPGLPTYVGEPSEELDDAWNELIGPVNVFVTPQEEPSLGGGLYFEPESKLYMAQVTVFHDLHCLNMLRQNLAIYSDAYEHNPPHILNPHLDHCIDSLRLSLMCAGDMTFSPIIWSYEQNRIMPDFEVDHTCRDYDLLKEWALLRDSADPNSYPANAERLHAEIDQGLRG